MNLLIESSNANHNWGDASMLHAAARRLIKQFGVSGNISLLRPHPAFERTYDHAQITSINPEERAAWIHQRPVWYRLDRHVPGVVDYATTTWPEVTDGITRAKMKMLSRDTEAHAAFLQRFESADALVVSGGGFITDLFDSAEQALNLVLLAHSRNIPVFMFGQGIGPIHSTRLFNKARRALPQAQHIAVREKRKSKPLLQRLGVPQDRILVTGDDAIELAYEERPDSIGSAIGVNLRLAFYSEVSDKVAEIVGHVVGDVAEAHTADLVPIPIAYTGHGSDVETISRIMTIAGQDSDGGASLNSPEDVARAAGQCRVVVTGSYHGGVFALSQGVPVVALSQSEYYDNKFHGLADMFGTGCTVLRTDASDFKKRLSESILETYDRAPNERGLLLDAAQEQIDASRTAYERMVDMIA